MFATEAAQRVIDRAVQLHGGFGVTKGVKVEELYREIRALRIYEGATEVQKVVIARELLKNRAGKSAAAPARDDGRVFWLFRSSSPNTGPPVTGHAPPRAPLRGGRPRAAVCGARRSRGHQGRGHRGRRHAAVARQGHRLSDRQGPDPPCALRSPPGGGDAQSPRARARSRARGLLGQGG